MDNKNIKQEFSDRWALTINNYNGSEFKMFDIILPLTNYQICGLEVSSDGRTPHLQVYLEFNSAQSFFALKSWFPRAHIEVAQKSGIVNQQYCSKSGVVAIDRGLLKERP